MRGVMGKREHRDLHLSDLKGLKGLDDPLIRNAQICPGIDRQMLERVELRHMILMRMRHQQRIRAGRIILQAVKALGEIALRAAAVDDDARLAMADQAAIAL